MLVHYVEFAHPGILVSDTSSKRIERRDESLVECSDCSFGWRFFDRTEHSLSGEKLVGKPQNYSGWTYYGEVWDLKRAAKEAGGDSILVRNMRGNGYDRVVRTQFGQCIPLDAADRVLAVSLRSFQNESVYTET